LKILVKFQTSYYELAVLNSQLQLTSNRLHITAELSKSGDDAKRKLEDWRRTHATKRKTCFGKALIFAFFPLWGEF
jgi:hypothetical protein